MFPLGSFYPQVGSIGSEEDFPRVIFIEGFLTRRKAPPSTGRRAFFFSKKRVETHLSLPVVLFLFSRGLDGLPRLRHRSLSLCFLLYTIDVPFAAFLFLKHSRYLWPASTRRHSTVVSLCCLGCLPGAVLPPPLLGAIRPKRILKRPTFPPLPLEEVLPVEA